MAQKKNPGRELTYELLLSGITCLMGYKSGNLRLWLHKHTHKILLLILLLASYS